MASTSRLITLARGRCRREATVYVKGFGARDETSTDFAAWTSSHERIAAWNGSQALGFTWMRGSRRNQIPIPFITAARAATELAVRGRRLMRFTPGAVATHVAGDLGLHAARLVKQFYDAKAGAREDGQRLADALRALRLDSDVRTVRVVAHSLGCLATVEALALLPLSERPDEVHLCAPALSAERLVADDVANGLARPSLDALSAGAEMNRRRGTTSVYYCRDDVVLGRCVFESRPLTSLVCSHSSLSPSLPLSRRQRLPFRRVRRTRGRAGRLERPRHCGRSGAALHTRTAPTHASVRRWESPIRGDSYCECERAAEP